MISGFVLSLQTVVWDTTVFRPSPKVILLFLTFQKFEEEAMQGRATGMAALIQTHFKVAPFTLCFYSLNEDKKSSLKEKTIYMLAVFLCYMFPSFFDF